MALPLSIALSRIALESAIARFAHLACRIPLAALVHAGWFEVVERARRSSASLTGSMVPDSCGETSALAL